MHGNDKLIRATSVQKILRNIKSYHLNELGTHVHLANYLKALLFVISEPIQKEVAVTKIDEM